MINLEYLVYGAGLLFGVYVALPLALHINTFMVVAAALKAAELFRERKNKQDGERQTQKLGG